MWGKRKANGEKERDVKQRTEYAIQNDVMRMREELNLRLLCDFVGGSCMEKDDRKIILELVKATDNVSLWEDLNSPGNVPQIESIDIVKIIWPVKRPLGKKILNKIKSLCSMLTELMPEKRNKK